MNEEQKNCPYCHANKDSEAWNEDGLCFKQIMDDPNIHVGYDTWGDISFDPETRTLTSWGDGTDPLIIDINYCPMCGRNLGGAQLMQTVWLIYKKWDYDEFAAESAYESREDAKAAIVKLQKEDIYDEYDFWLEEIPLVMHKKETKRG